MIRYYVCGIGYDKNECVTDYEQDFGDFDTYEEAYKCFVRCQCKSVATFNMPYNIHSMLIQLEECEENENLIECVNVINEWVVINPNFKQTKTMPYKRSTGKAMLTNAKETLWKQYLIYLTEWAKDHKDIGYYGMTPADYDEWLDNELMGTLELYDSFKED